MVDEKDYYDILGVSRKATLEEIKRAYKRKALEWHPDKNKTAEAEKKFKEINEAYQVLSDKEKRAAYDRFGSAAFRPGGFGATGPFTRTYREGPFTYTYTTYGGGGSPGAASGWDFGGFADPFEIFEEFFGFRSPFERGQRLPVYELTLDFLEAVKGTEKTIKIPGEAKERQVKIPAGVHDGSRIRFGDFNLIVSVRPHEKFLRQGDDIIVEQPLSFVQAALGETIGVPTIEGEVKLKIRGGTQPGTLVRLRGRGVPHLRGGGRGDQYVRLKVEIPERLTKEQKRLLEKLAQTF